MGCVGCVWEAVCWFLDGLCGGVWAKVHRIGVHAWWGLVCG